MGIEKIATQSELCRKNIENTEPVLTDIKDYVLYPMKLRLSFCLGCNSYVQNTGIDYCLKKRGK